MSESTLGPTLGEDTINAGLYSITWAFVGVMAFMIFYYRFAGLVASIASLGVGLIAYRAGDAHWQTLLFTTLIFGQTALAIGVRSETQPFWKRPLSNPALVGAVVLTGALQLAAVYVPFLQRVLRTTPMPAHDLLIAFAAGAGVLAAVELWKWRVRRGGAGSLTTPDSLSWKALR